MAAVERAREVTGHTPRRHNAGGCLLRTTGTFRTMRIRREIRGADRERTAGFGSRRVCFIGKKKLRQSCAGYCVLADAIWA